MPVEYSRWKKALFILSDCSFICNKAIRNSRASKRAGALNKINNKRPVQAIRED
jgi:hypothetical protein